MAQSQRLFERPEGVLLIRHEANGEGRWREDDSYKVLFAAVGTIRYQTKSGPFTLMDHQFAILNPQIRHKQMGFDQEKCLVQLPLQFLHEVSEQLGYNHDPLFAFQIQKHPQLTRWMQATREFLSLYPEDDLPAIRIFLDHALVQLAILLVTYGWGSHTKQVFSAPDGKAGMLLIPAIHAMKENYAETWTLDEMARLTHLSKYQFARLFKETMGISPYSWLQLYRLVQSQERLQKTEERITDIAQSCGFASIDAYLQLFRRVYGMTPGAFRKRYR